MPGIIPTRQSFQCQVLRFRAAALSFMQPGLPALTSCLLTIFFPRIMSQAGLSGS